MKAIYNNIIPPKGYQAINLFGIIFVRKDIRVPMSREDFNHEAIHTKQIWELLGIIFYILYFLDWIVKLFIYKFDSDKAYRNICFEREAYINQNNLKYLSNRKKYSSFRYLTKKYK